VNVALFLADLRNRDIHVWPDGEQLRCNAPAGALTADLREELRQRRKDIVEFLRAADAAARQQPAIVPLQPRGTHVPIFAVGGHNGDVFCYRALARHLGEDQPFFGLEPPGVDGRHTPLTAVEDLARYFATQIREFRPQHPYILAGYCAGGAIAFEVARQLSQHGASIRFVALFAGQYPTWFGPLGQRRQHVIDMLERVRVHSRSLASLSNAERCRYVADMVRRNTARHDDTLQGAPEPVLVHRQQVQHATMIGIRRYRPPYFAGRLSLFLPNRRWLRSSTAVRRWRPLARDIDEYVGPDGCEGEEMLLEPHAQAIAALFRRCREENDDRLRPSASAQLPDDRLQSTR
jgi:thioesterase domain-containing protein